VAKKINPKQLTTIREKLREQAAELQQRLTVVVEQGRQAGTEGINDVADQAVSSYEKEILFTRGTHEHGQLRRIQQALARLEEGNYGSCQRCEQMIGEKRLEALPWTPYCIACQEELERNAESEQRRVAS
jgi:DnaK suppressor protein